MICRCKQTAVFCIFPKVKFCHSVSSIWPLSSNRGCKRTRKKKLPGKLPCKSCEAIECSLLWCLQVEQNECRQESFCLLRLRPFLSVSRYSHPKWPIEFCCLKSEFWLDGNRYSNTISKFNLQKREVIKHENIEQIEKNT